MGSVSNRGPSSFNCEINRLAEKWYRNLIRISSRMAIGLGQIQHAVPINRVFAELTKQPGIPDIMAATQQVEDCGEIPDIVGLAAQILDMAQDAKQFGKLKSDPLTVQGVAFLACAEDQGEDARITLRFRLYCT